MTHTHTRTHVRTLIHKQNDKKKQNTFHNPISLRHYVKVRW